MNNDYKVIIAGSINMDVVATTQRHPRVGETVPGRDLHFFPGGKGANQAVAAAKQGVCTLMVGRIGADGFGTELRSFLTDKGVDLTFVTEDAAPTGTALIVVDNAGDNAIVVVPGANGNTTVTDTGSVPISKGDVLISQFEIPLDTIAAFLRRGRECGATTVLNPAPALECAKDVLSLADILVVNETELAFFARAGIEEDASEDRLTELATKVRTFPDQIIVVTLGAKGVLVVLGARRFRIAGHSVNVIDSTGAGDCFVGNLAAALSQGHTLDRAVEQANLAASLCVTRMGAGPSMPTASELVALEGVTQ